MDEKKGLEGTGLNLRANRHGNLTSASSGEGLKGILHNIKSSKYPVWRVQPDPPNILQAE